MHNGLSMPAPIPLFAVAGDARVALDESAP